MNVKIDEETEVCLSRPKIDVLLRRVYGNERFYPISEDAKVVTNLMQVQTLTKDQLKFCKDSGWQVSVKTEEYSF